MNLQVGNYKSNTRKPILTDEEHAETLAHLQTQVVRGNGQSEVYRLGAGCGPIPLAKRCLLDGSANNSGTC